MTLPAQHFQRYAIGVVVVLLIASWLSAPFPEKMVLQHVPTIAVLVGGPILLSRFPLSNAAIACLVAFLLLHVLGARYIYSFVPYDAWSQALFGVSISDRLGFQRNHFDRIVHFAFGALWIRPIWEIFVRYFEVPRRLAYYTAFEFILAFSMVYELIEWGLWTIVTNADADAYIGRQGDMWDAQKDTLLALLGALVALAVLYLTRRQRRHVPPVDSLKPLPAGDAD